MADFLTSLLRTFAPVVAGAIITWALAHGVVADDSLRQPLAEVLAVAFTSGYYLAARLLERVWPPFGWLLLAPRPPAYKARKEARK